jgi:hypothetical protein
MVGNHARVPVYTTVIRPDYAADEAGCKAAYLFRMADFGRKALTTASRVSM